TTKLNGALPAGGNAFSGFQVSPDGSTVVYVADQDTNNVFELYSVPIGGGATTKLNGALPAGGFVYSGFHVSPNGSTVVYRADQDTDRVLELYSVPIGGGATTKLNDALPAGGDVPSDFQISPDSSTVVFYVAYQGTNQAFELHAAWLQSRWIRAGGIWSEDDNWSSGETPDAIIEAVIATPAVVRIPSGDFATTRSLVLGGGVGSSTVLLSGGSVLELPLGARFAPGAVIGGSGLVWMGQNPLTLLAGTEVRARYGDSLVIQSGPVTNAGRIEALGSSSLPVELELSGALTNTPETGTLLARNSLLRFPGGVQNNGSLAFSGGFNDVLGDITNLPGGLITVSGGSTVIFNEDVANGGIITVSTSGPLTSTAIFFGEFSGNGVAGSGSVFIEGDMRPGFSPGTMHFGGNVGYGPLATLHLEIGGTAPDRYDRVKVDGNLDLGGSLAIEFIDGYVPEAGATFQLLRSGTLIGSFASVMLPPLPEGRQWDTSRLESEGLLVVEGTFSDAWLAQYFSAIELGNPALQSSLWGWGADPDGDGLTNLMEYALGGDPRVGSTLFADGSLLGAGLEVIDEVAVVRHPERSDREERGLDYVVEFSRDLENWSTEPPAGAPSSLSPHNPPVAGFQQHVIRWPATERDFIRLRVILTE
ncbi:MAG: hypothetical protein MK194_15245, partial [Roseibacillus sp.]|nr:hypothetical protein [Roseibacillus sp.]